MQQPCLFLIVDRLLADERLSRLGYVLAAVLCLVFAVFAVRHTLYYADLVSDTYNDRQALTAGDFSVYYIAARMLVSDDRGSLYDNRAQYAEYERVSGIPKEVYLIEGKESHLFYNPPVFYVAFLPLTLFDLGTAYLIFAALNVVASIVLALLIGMILRWRQPWTALLVLGMLGCQPLYRNIAMGQLSILLALAVGFCFYAQQRSHFALARAFLYVLVIKPQWLVFPALLLLRWHPASLKPMLLTGALLVSLPFVFLGAGALGDYLSFLVVPGEVVDRDLAPTFLSWTGFLEVATGSPQPLLWVILSGLTALLFILILWRGDAGHLPLAAVLTTLLIVPGHLHDWVIIAPAAAFLFARPSSRVAVAGTAVLLLGIYFGVSHYGAANSRFGAGHHVIYWAPVFAFATLFWLAALTFLEGRSTEQPLAAAVEPAIAEPGPAQLDR